MANLLTCALWYASTKGWHVFPCREKDGLMWVDDKGVTHLPRAKSPYVKFGLNVATTDRGQISEWWQRWPNAAIGCNCGKSGIFVFDLDRKDGKDGWAVFRDMQIDHEGALHSVTPSGGIHIVYSGHGKSSSSPAGLDTRGDGGYIILPPSEIEGKGDYFASDDWRRTPAPVDQAVLERLFPAHPAPVQREYPALSPDEEIQRAKKAIDAISPVRAQNYDEKMKVGMALTKLGGQGLELFHQFCKKDLRPGKYIPAEIDEHWQRIQNTSVTLGTLFYFARQDSPNWNER
jgi:hypothetical protein